MANWFKPRYKIVARIQNKTFGSIFSRLRYYLLRRGKRLIRKGRYTRHLKVLKSLKWNKLRFQFGAFLYNFSIRKKRKNRFLNIKNRYKVELLRKKAFLSFYGKISPNKFQKIFQKYYNESKRFKVLSLLNSIESRTDVILFRLRFLPTIFMSNSFIRTYGITVNHRKNFLPGYSLQIGDIVNFQNINDWTFFMLNIFKRLRNRYNRHIILNQNRRQTKFLIKSYMNSGVIQKQDVLNYNKSYNLDSLQNSWKIFLKANMYKLNDKPISEVIENNSLNSTSYLLYNYCFYKNFNADVLPSLENEKDLKEFYSLFFSLIYNMNIQKTNFQLDKLKKNKINYPETKFSLLYKYTKDLIWKKHYKYKSFLKVEGKSYNNWQNDLKIYRNNVNRENLNTFIKNYQEIFFDIIYYFKRTILYKINKELYNAFSFSNNFYKNSILNNNYLNINQDFPINLQSLLIKDSKNITDLKNKLEIFKKNQNKQRNSNEINIKMSPSILLNHFLNRLFNKNNISSSKRFKNYRKRNSLILNQTKKQKYSSKFFRVLLSYFIKVQYFLYKYSSKSRKYNNNPILYKVAKDLILLNKFIKQLDFNRSFNKNIFLKLLELPFKSFINFNYLNSNSLKITSKSNKKSLDYKYSLKFFRKYNKRFVLRHKLKNIFLNRFFSSLKLNISRKFNRIERISKSTKYIKVSKNSYIFKRVFRNFSFFKQMFSNILMKKMSLNSSSKIISTYNLLDNNVPKLYNLRKINIEKNSLILNNINYNLINKDFNISENWLTLSFSFLEKMRQLRKVIEIFSYWILEKRYSMLFLLRIWWILKNFMLIFSKILSSSVNLFKLISIFIWFLAKLKKKYKNSMATLFFWRKTFYNRILQYKFNILNSFRELNIFPLKQLTQLFNSINALQLIPLYGTALKRQTTLFQQIFLIKDDKALKKIAKVENLEVWEVYLRILVFKLPLFNHYSDPQKMELVNFLKDYLLNIEKTTLINSKTKFLWNYFYVLSKNNLNDLFLNELHKIFFLNNSTNTQENLINFYKLIKLNNTWIKASRYYINKKNNNFPINREWFFINGINEKAIESKKLTFLNNLKENKTESRINLLVKYKKWKFSKLLKHYKTKKIVQKVYKLSKWKNIRISLDTTGITFPFIGLDHDIKKNTRKHKRLYNQQKFSLVKKNSFEKYLTLNPSIRLPKQKLLYYRIIKNLQQNFFKKRKKKKKHFLRIIYKKKNKKLALWRLKIFKKRLNLRQISRKRSKKFYGLRSFPSFYIPSHLEMDFKTLRIIMISLPNKTTTLYPGGSSQYLYSFLAFHQRLGV